MRGFMIDVVAALAPFLDLDAAALSAADVQPRARAAFAAFVSALEQGTVRAAHKGDDGRWLANPEVKRGILLGFRLGGLVQMGDATLPFVDKDTYPVRAFDLAERVRLVPGGSSVRRGAHVGAAVTIMPPAYINVGAFVDLAVEYLAH